jgi:hypothetical protein
MTGGKNHHSSLFSWDFPGNNTSHSSKSSNTFVYSAAWKLDAHARGSIEPHSEWRYFVDLSHRLPQRKQLYPVNLHDIKSVSMLNVQIQYGLEILVLFKFYEHIIL